MLYKCFQNIVIASIITGYKQALAYMITMSALKDLFFSFQGMDFSDPSVFPDSCGLALYFTHYGP